MINIALFGCTAKDWRQANMNRALAGENIRDIASINELAILSNIESLNSTLIKNNVGKKERFKIIYETVKEQRARLDSYDFIKSIKKKSNANYLDVQEQQKLSSFNENLKKELNFNPKDKEED
jgi:hypothetical protein